MSEHRIALISGAADPNGRTSWAELRRNNEGSLGLEKGYPGGYESCYPLFSTAPKEKDLILICSAGIHDFDP